MSLRWRDREAVLPPDPCSTARFMASFGLWTALVYGLFGGVRANWFDIFYHWYVRGFLSTLHGAFLGLVLGYAQAALLGRRRWKVEGWVRWTVIGILAGNLVTSFALEGVAGMMGSSLRSLGSRWLDGLVWSVSFGLFMGLATGRALWKDAWPTNWPFWLLGRAGFTVLGWAAAEAVQVLPWPDRIQEGDKFMFRCALLALQGVVAGVLEGAGSAWLLDRQVFRPTESR